jgi:F0F1-type ATP synthase membrane subunit b/b'
MGRLILMLIVLLFFGLFVNKPLTKASYLYNQKAGISLIGSKVVYASDASDDAQEALDKADEAMDKAQEAMDDAEEAKDQAEQALDESDD